MLHRGPQGVRLTGPNGLERHYIFRNSTCPDQGIQGDSEEVLPSEMTPFSLLESSKNLWDTVE